MDGLLNFRAHKWENSVLKIRKRLGLGRGSEKTLVRIIITAARIKNKTVACLRVLLYYGKKCNRYGVK